VTRPMRLDDIDLTDLDRLHTGVRHAPVALVPW
jgi:hypothetical protein